MSYGRVLLMHTSLSFQARRVGMSDNVVMMCHKDASIIVGLQHKTVGMPGNTCSGEKVSY